MCGNAAQNGGIYMVRNILLDLDDTLFDFHMAERMALIKTLGTLGIPAAEETVSRYSEINDAQWKLLEQGKILRDELKVRRYRLLFDELDIEADAAEAARIYEKNLGKGHYFMDGAEGTLAALHGRYRLYIVSNGTASVQESRIKSAGIAPLFDGIFISQLIGCNKPSAGFFTYCFERIPDFDRRETVIVGDSLSSDIAGGKNAGITTVWFNPKGIENTSGIIPDHEIAHLLELPALVGTL